MTQQNYEKQKHVHFIKDCSWEEDGHKYRFQAATLIESPTDFECKD